VKLHAEPRRNVDHSRTLTRAERERLESLLLYGGSARTWASARGLGPYQVERAVLGFEVSAELLEALRSEIGASI
jgi:hypothetical protein